MKRAFTTLMALALFAAACSSAGSSAAQSSGGVTAIDSIGPSPTAGAMSMAPSGGSSAPSPASASTAAAVTAPPDATVVHVLDFKIEPAALTIRGPAITLFVTNDGPTVHNVTIRDQSGKVLMATPDLRPGESAVLAGSLAPASYVMFCSLPGHESLGTRGTLVVSP